MIVTDQNVVNSKFVICDSGNAMFSIGVDCTYTPPRGVLIKGGGPSKIIRLDSSLHVMDAHGNYVVSYGVVTSPDGSTSSEPSNFNYIAQAVSSYDGRINIPAYTDCTRVYNNKTNAAIVVGHRAPSPYASYYGYSEPLQCVTIEGYASPLIVFGGLDDHIDVIPNPTQSNVVISGANLNVRVSRQESFGTFFIGQTLQFPNGQGQLLGLQLINPTFFAPKEKNGCLQLAGTYKLTSDTTILDVDGTPIVLNGKRV